MAFSTHTSVGYVPTQNVVVEHNAAATRNTMTDWGTENPSRGYHVASQPYQPVQSDESLYNHPHESLATHGSQPEAYVGPWQSETEWTETPTASKSPSNASWFEGMNNGWTPEIVCEVFSVAFLLAMIILLSRLDGRPLSTWNIAVSANAVIAILSIASKASLIYALGQTISQLKWLHLLKKPDGSANPLQYPALSASF